MSNKQINSSEIASYNLYFDRQDSLLMGVRLVVELDSGEKHFLNDAHYSDIPKAAAALPDVLEDWRKKGKFINSWRQQ